MKKTIFGIIGLCLISAFNLQAQAYRISGTVTDGSSGNPMLGVTVYIKGTSKGVITDADGHYSIALETDTVKLVYSFVGMRSLEIPVAGKSNIDVSLQPELVGLDEIVVVGYGSQSKKLLTGSVGTIDSKQIDNIPVASVDQALQGRLSGVRVFSNSGTPGGGISVRIRGSSSISADNQPLYIIDGIPVVNGDYSQQGFGGQGISAINDLNAADIESYQVLKDASYAAIYGARAANGVVLITTKKGAEGPLKVDFSMYTGTQKMAKKLDLLDAHDYMVLINEAIYNAYGIPEYLGDPNYPRANTDWQDKVTRVAPHSEYQLSFSGANNKISYYISGTYFDQTGIVIGSDFKRFSGRVNLEAKASERLKLGTNLSFTRSDIHRIYGDNNIYGPLSNAIANPPNEPVYNPDGTYYNTYYANPLAMAKEPMHKVMSFRNLLSFYAEYKLATDLYFKSSVNADVLNLREDSFLPADIGLAAGSSGAGTAGNSNLYRLVNENTLTWDRTFAEVHNLTLLGGFSYEVNNEYYSLVNGIEFPGNNFKYLVAAADINGGSSSTTSYKLASFFGRMNYDYNKKYLMQIILRADGSSRFGADKRYGFFPSASAGWRIIQEPFMANQHIMSDLKLTASVGSTGNQEIGNFGSLSLWAPGNNYLDLPGISPAQLGNSKLGWERTTTFEGGLTTGFLRDRIVFNMNLYLKKTTNLLLSRPILTVSGFGSIAENVGEIDNKGIEFNLNTINLQSAEGFNWTTGFNISFNRNTVVTLYGDQPINTGFANRFEVGHPYGAFYGLQFLGVNRDDGSIVYKDRVPDGQITDDDRTFIGDPNPKYDGGLSNNLSYKGFDLSLFFQFVQGNDIFNATRIYSEGYYLDNQTSRMMKRWQQPGDITDIPKAMYADPQYGYISSRFIEDGSFVRLKTTSIGYTLPVKLLGHLHVRSFKIYVTAENFLTWTKYSGIDPEVNFAGTSNTTLGTDFYTYPLAKSVVVGFKLGL